jgi:Secretion system C-terminal sorting domain
MKQIDYKFTVSDITKKVYLILVLLVAYSYSMKATILISSTVNNGGFESGATGWTIVNASQTNKWFIGTTAFCNGTQAAYVGTAAGNNNYTTSSSSVVHLYTDITFPAGEGCINLSFNYAGQGESGADYLRVYIVPTSTTPVAGTLLPGANQVGTNYNLQGSCTNAALTLSAAFAGTTQRVVFTWRNNNNSGTSPAIRLDDVTIVTSTGLANDDPCAAEILTVNPTCTYATYSNGCATATTAGSPPAPGCAGYSGGDVWFSVTVPASGSLTFDTQTGVMLDGGMAIYSGTCGALSLISCDNDNSANGAMPMIVATGLTVSSTIYIRVWENGNDNNGTFGICVTDPCFAGPPANDDPCSATSLTVGLTCTYATYTNTCATATTAGSPPAPGCAGYSGGDVWFSVTVPASGSLTFDTQTGVMLDGGMAIYSGTCGALTLISCDNDNSANGAMPMIAANGLTPATTIFIRVWENGNNNNGTFGICVINPCPSGGPTNDDPCAAIPITVGLTCTYATYTNACATATTAGSPPAPGCAGYSGGDVWFSVTVPASGNLTFDTQTGVMLDGGMAIYSGTCGALSLISCDDDNSANGAMPMITASSLTPGTTIFIRVWENGNNNNGTFGICVTNPCPAGAPANDLPCNATPLALNINLSGDNGCSGSGSEPGAASCWTTGTINTVWYTVICPASGQIRVKTTIGTLTNTQIALYSGTCGSLTQVGCNDNAAACGTSTYNNSDLLVTGLTSGATYFIRVDGANNLTGAFDILAIDGTTILPPLAGQDCGSPNPVCASTILVGNPGYQAYGNVCDFNGAGTCLTSGERGIAWYTIPINAAGNLEFDIVPNDYGNPNPLTGQINAGYAAAGDETDYDFGVWKIAGAGATTCTAIASVGGSTPVACNYNSLGVTGCFGTGNSPGIYPGFNASYEPLIPVVAGDVYLLAVSNFSNSTSGFTLVFSAGSPINYSGAGTSVTWTGGNNTNWALSANWGGCAVPTCGLDAVIVPAAFNQPVLTAGTYNVRNLTIDPGATLTLLPGAVLNVCGDFLNNGSLVASPTSTIVFNNGSVNQTITGALVGADKFGNLTITKTGGTVTLNNNIDIGGNFTTSNATSVFNTTGKYIKLAGNFTNNNGSSTFTNVGTVGTLEFNGTAAQTYNQGASTLTLNNVLMNHTSTGVTAATNMVIGTSGTLTLTLGRIITNANEVQVTNTANTSCTAGNASSFVQGNLRRYLNGAAGAYDFPVGHATPGYELANIAFTTVTTIPQLLARFDPWAVLPFGPVASECPTNTYNILNAENHGYWTITASANPTSGNYDITLYNVGYTNSVGAAAWTVMKAPAISGTWALNGTCAASTDAITSRTGLNGFSVFATAQSVSPLPIELLSFDGTATADYNHLEWVTVVENNNDYFTLERSTDGVTFTEIARIDGAGNSTQLINYSFNDMNPADGYNYYRLKQTDFNGQYTYSNVVPLTFHRGNMLVENVRPNPTNGNINFDFASPDDTEIHYIITDVTGRVIVDEKTSVKAGRTTLATSIASEGAGIYSLKIIESKHGFVSVTRIVKF